MGYQAVLLGIHVQLEQDLRRSLKFYLLDNRLHFYLLSNLTPLNYFSSPSAHWTRVSRQPFQPPLWSALSFSFRSPSWVKVNSVRPSETFLKSRVTVVS